MYLLRRARHLWGDECGVVIAAELLLIVLIVGLGLIAGLASMRDGFTQELADTGLAVNNMNQGYDIMGTSIMGVGSTNGSTFDDNEDDNDGADPANAPPPGLDIDGHVSTGE
jgi:hypothetical protein